MSETKLISPLLDNFIMGEPISNHHGVRCCPALKKESEDKYIVKIISIPASQTQLDALLLTGAYPDEATALSYFRELAEGVQNEVNILKNLSQLEGFLPYENLQVVPMEGQTGFEVYLLSPYKRTLSRHFIKDPLTHLGAINLGLDLCASLAVCRRSGYLYVDLKPNNVFVTGEKEYRIGDIGFVKLDSLKYASLPDKYRSAYTAPEITDALSALNPTIDVYAAGLILYQAYNNGELPFSGDTAPAEAFQAPMYADYEMAEIILKACAPNPEDRWEDPIQMGQALVSYMQRNGANDTPIVPVPVSTEPEQEVDVTESQPEPQQTASETIDDETPGENGSVTEETASVPITVEDAVPEHVEQTADDPLYTEDDEGNLTFLSAIQDEEFPADQISEEIAYDEITDEVSEILSQADALVSHPVPDPVVAPEPVDIPIPDPISIEEEDRDEITAEEIDSAETDIEPEVVHRSEPAQELQPKKKRSSRVWIPICLALLLLLALLVGGFYYYQNYYLQSVESIVTEGSEDSLTVYVNSNISQEKLLVICSDAYGNQIPMPVTDGKAVFNKLVPNTGYTISVQVKGFHKLIGQTAAAYSTPVQTSIVQFNAVTGSEDGSVILSFTPEGPDASQWKVVYSAPGAEERSAVLLSHTTTLTGLTIGKEYTFTLVPDTDLFLVGTDQITFTPSKLVYAQDLTVTGCANDKLTVKWSAPENSNVESWTVRCYNKNGYDKSMITSETAAVFDILDCTSDYTVEVTAGGMSVNERIFVPANSITATDFHAQTDDYQTLTLTWNTSVEIPEDGWLLQYTITGTETVWSVVCKKNTTHLTPVLPGTTYTFKLLTSDGVPLLSDNLLYEVPAAPDFQGTFGGMEVTRADLEFKMCKTPSKSNWSYNDVKDSDFTTTFATKQSASFLVKLNKSYGSDSTEMDILYLVRDAEGNPVSSSIKTFRWRDMWSKYYCELDIPNMPSTPGNYIISVYFNGGLAAEQAFTVQS